MGTAIHPQILATIRSVLLALGGAAAAKGLIDESTMTSVVGAVTFIVPYAWSLWGHRTAGAIAAAAALPDVHQIVTTREIADSPAFALNSTVVGPRR